MSTAKVEPLRFAHLPTPIDHLSRLGRELEIAGLFVKRDDQTGLAFGGNKTRKLEFLLGDAKRKGARTLITRGAAQSNHCRQTAAAAARFGFDCVLVLSGSKPPDLGGNLLLDKLLGAQWIWTGDQDPEHILEEQYQKLYDAGSKPYLIPYGGSNEIGAFAYVEAIQELLDQDPDFDRIVLATSSGGTQAGMCLGAELSGFKGKVTGISVDLSSEEIRTKVASISNWIAQWMNCETSITKHDVIVYDNFLGGGYGIVSELEQQAIVRFARTEGILLDPVYTARAAGGMISLINEGIISKKERVLFWHTGGTPSLFAYADTFGLE